MAEQETALSPDEEERMLQSSAKEQIVPTAVVQFTPIVEKKKTFLDTLLDIFGSSSSSKDDDKVSVAKKKKITLLGKNPVSFFLSPKNISKMRKYHVVL
ncbi:hypothetical protein DMENIID0001_162790 [Sergentomyia squamirostris]